jgi:hypothetical protein
VDALAEAALQAAGQRDGGFAEAVAQPVGGRERLLPALVLAGVQHPELACGRGERRRPHSQQADFSPALPVGAEERARRGEDLRIELRGLLQLSGG